MSSDRDNTFVKTVDGAGRRERDSDGREERPRNSYVDLHAPSILVSESTQPSTNGAEAVLSNVGGVEGPPLLTIPDLLDMIQAQNGELGELRVLQTKYEAISTRLAKLEAENKALEEGLIQTSEELKHCKEQVKGLTRENDRLRDALFNKDEQIKRAYAERNTRIYEIKHPARESTSTQTVSTEQQDTYVRSDVPTGQSSLSNGVKRRKFNCEPCAVPQCRNCNAVFDKIDPASVHCAFHRANPQPYSVWKTQPDAKEADKDSLYWPCCRVFSRRLPPGCLRLKHHEIYYPDSQAPNGRE